MARRMLVPPITATILGRMVLVEVDIVVRRVHLYTNLRQQRQHCDHSYP